MQQVKYKGTDFQVKDNVLGIGKVISEYSAKFEDDMAIAQYTIIRMPDYGLYAITIHNISMIANDLKELQEKIKTAKGKTKTDLQKAIKSDEKAIEKEAERLKDPVMEFIFNRVTNIRKEVLFGFQNDTEIFKTLCDTLLTGDTSKINYTEPDDELIELRDKVYAVCLFSSAKMDAVRRLSASFIRASIA